MLTEREKRILDKYLRGKEEGPKEDPEIIDAMEKIYYSGGREGTDFSPEVEKKILEHLGKLHPEHDYSGLIQRLRNPERAKFAAYTVLRSFPKWERR